MFANTNMPAISMGYTGIEVAAICFAAFTSADAIRAWMC